MFFQIKPQLLPILYEYVLRDCIMLYQAHHVEAIKILLEEGVESLLALQDYDEYQHYEGELTEEEWREEEAQMKEEEEIQLLLEERERWS